MVRSSLIVTLLMFSAAAGAQGFDYNFLQLNYGNLEFDNIDGGGSGLSRSLAINSDWHVLASYQAADLKISVDDNGLSFGLGGLYNFTDAFSLGLGASWADNTSTYTLSGRIYFGK